MPAVPLLYRFFLLHQEEYCEWGSFKGWFDDVSVAWQQVLAQKDSGLGLAHPRGKKGGYRAVLMKLLKRWEKEVNEMLEMMMDDHADGKKARLFATKALKAPKKPAASAASGRGAKRGRS